MKKLAEGETALELGVVVNPQDFRWVKPMKKTAAEDFRDNFEEKTTKGKDGCISWNGAVNSDGYSVIKWHKDLKLASHVAWYLKHGNWPKHIVHTCDNPRCVNTEHMVVGDQKINLRDMRAKGHSRPGGELQPPSGEKTAGQVARAMGSQSLRKLPASFHGSYLVKTRRK